MNPDPSLGPASATALRELQREQIQLRVRLASVLLAAICAFALLLSWLAQGDPLRPLLAVKISLLGLLFVYAVSVSVAAIYARWIRLRREPAVAAAMSSDNSSH